jgi:hypothetical protein
MNIINTIITFFRGKDLTPMWQQFTDEKQGKLKSSSGDLYIEYLYSNFQFQLAEKTRYQTDGKQTTKQKYIVGIVCFTNPNNFELSISQDDLYAKIKKALKNNDIETGYKNFDDTFYIKSNHEFKAKSILLKKTVMEQLTAVNPSQLEITTEKGFFNEVPPNGKYQLYFTKPEKVTNSKQLHIVHELLVTFIESLKGNCQIQN